MISETSFLWNLAGQRGSIYEYGNGLLVATVLNAPNSYHWSKYQEKAKSLGCLITQNGDNEGSFLFDPANENQSKLAIEAVQAYRRRIVTEEQRLNLAKHGARTRFSSVKTPRKPEGREMTPETLKVFAPCEKHVSNS